MNFRRSSASLLCSGEDSPAYGSGAFYSPARLLRRLSPGSVQKHRNDAVRWGIHISAANCGRRGLPTRRAQRGRVAACLRQEFFPHVLPVRPAAGARPSRVPAATNRFLAVHHIPKGRSGVAAHLMHPQSAAASQHDFSRLSRQFLTMTRTQKSEVGRLCKQGRNLGNPDAEKGMHTRPALTPSGMTPGR